MVPPAASGFSRRRLLGGLAAGGAASVALAACGSSELAEPPAAGELEDEFGPGDGGIVGFGLTLERIAAAFYAAALASGLLDDAVAALYERIAADEDAHVAELEALAAELGAELPGEPDVAFEFADAGSATAMAPRLENLIAAGFLGQIPNLGGERARGAFAAIQAVEGAHAVAVASLIGGPPTPNGALARPGEPDAILDALENLG